MMMTLCAILMNMGQVCFKAQAASPDEVPQERAVILTCADPAETGKQLNLPPCPKPVAQSAESKPVEAPKTEEKKDAVP